MLVSKRKDGSMFSLADKRDRGELERLSAEGSFFCPVCGNAVKMKLGKFKRWHFAHVNLTSCENGRGGGETEGHLEAKRQLFTRLKETGEHVMIEPYLPELQQRPDLLIIKNSVRIAVEYQNSIADSAVIQNRIQNYRRAGIKSIWLLSEDHLNRIAANRYRISNFHWLFAYQHTADALPRLLFYSPSSRKLFILNDILPLTASQVLAIPAYVPLSAVIFSHLYTSGGAHRPISFYQQEWLRNKKRWRYSVHRDNSRRTQQLNRKFYRAAGKPLSLSPPQAGVPLKENIYFTESPAIWQLAILLEVIMPLQPGRGLPLQKLKRIAYGMIAGRQITRSNLYCSSDAVVKTVQAYMDYLSAEGILLKRPNQIYIKRQELTLPKSAESTAALDKQAVQNAFEFMSGI